jgi:hypothetical protein
MSRDSSCRPHELLKLKIKDVVFRMTGDRQYPEILVNGKTGQRHIRFINSIPYLKDWMDNHPQFGNPNAFLICGFGKSLGRQIGIATINHVYSDYKKRIFPKLLTDPIVPVLAGASSYALSDAFGWKQRFFKKFKQARAFYLVIRASTVIALGINFTYLNPIKALIYIQPL